MNPDGSGQQRLTFLNEPWSTEYRGYTVVGGLAFDPNNPNRFIADISPDMSAHQLDAVMITLNDSQTGGGLTGQYFADTNFGKQVLTRTENPSNGFKWDGSPAPGVPASGYSVRWSGSISGTATGNYTYCVIADDGARLWVAGQSW